MTEQVDILDLLKSKEGGSGSYVPPININETTTQKDETNVLEILQSKEVEYVNPEPIVESQPVSKRVLEPMVIPKDATDDEALAMQLVPQKRGKLN